MDHKFFTNSKGVKTAVPKVTDAVPKVNKAWNSGLIDKRNLSMNIKTKTPIKPGRVTGLSMIGSSLAKNTNIFSNSMSKIAKAQNQAIKANINAKYGSEVGNVVTYTSPKTFFNSIASGANSSHDIISSTPVIEQIDHSNIWATKTYAKETPDHNFLNRIDKDWLLIGGLMLCAIIM